MKRGVVPAVSGKDLIKAIPGLGKIANGDRRRWCR